MYSGEPYARVSFRQGITTMKTKLAIVLIGLLTPVLAPAQTDDAAAERARIANQRIQAEAARQAREEEERQQEIARQEAEQARRQVELAQLEARQAAAVAEQEKQQLAAVEPVSGNTATGGAVAPAPSRSTDMSKVLEQLRTLGELKDAGYVTDDEFERIKKKILDATN